MQIEMSNREGRDISRCADEKSIIEESRSSRSSWLRAYLKAEERGCCNEQHEGWRDTYAKTYTCAFAAHEVDFTQLRVIVKLIETRM